MLQVSYAPSPRRLNYICLMAQPTEQHRPVKRSSLVSICTVRAFSGLYRGCPRAEALLQGGNP